MSQRKHLYFLRIGPIINADNRPVITGHAPIKLIQPELNPNGEKINESNTDNDLNAP